MCRKKARRFGGALGSGLSTYAGLTGQAALDQSRRGYLPATAPPTYDGGSASSDIGNQSIVDYYLSLLGKTPETASGEISISPGDTGSVRVGG